MDLFFAWVKKQYSGLDRSWKDSFLLWLAARLGLGLWAAWIFTQQLMPLTSGYFYFSIKPILNGLPGALWGMWQRWDSIHYQKIAEDFYNSFLSAFFPGYPLLGRFLTQLTGLPVVVSLLIISSIAVFFCMVLLYQISRDLFPGQGIARGSILCLVLFPSAFFLFGIFPQSLALLWILLAYHQAQRDHWLAAGLAGLLAGLTHFTAIPLALLLAVQSLQALRGSRFSLRWPALLSVPVFPLLGIAIFLVWREWMGYPSMISFQNQNWGRNFSPPWNIVSNLLHYFLANWPPNWVLLFNTIIFLLAIISAVWGIRHLPLSLNVYQITLLFVILSYSSKTGDPLGSFNRYILLQFPMMIAFGSLRLGHYARLAIFGFCLLVSLGVSAMFFMWKWVG